ncbi:Acetylornithine aminotransferase, partial [Hortaea werneckii]
MSVRACSQRIGAAIRTTQPRQVTRAGRRTYASSATQASTLPPGLKDAIEKEASLPNPDPPTDSQTTRLTSSQAPFMVPTYVRPPPMFQQGEGCWIWDVENRQYLDFTAGIAVNALGHCDSEMSKILYQQSQTLVHSSNLYHNPWIGALSQLLVEKTKEQGGMKDVGKVFICNSGSEANEAA